MGFAVLIRNRHIDRAVFGDLQPDLIAVQKIIRQIRPTAATVDFGFYGFPASFVDVLDTDFYIRFSGVPAVRLHDGNDKLRVKDFRLLSHALGKVIFAERAIHIDCASGTFLCAGTFFGVSGLLRVSGLFRVSGLLRVGGLFRVGRLYRISGLFRIRRLRVAGVQVILAGFAVLVDQFFGTFFGTDTGIRVGQKFFTHTLFRILHADLASLVGVFCGALGIANTLRLFLGCRRSRQRRHAQHRHGK